MATAISTTKDFYIFLSQGLDELNDYLFQQSTTTTAATLFSPSKIEKIISILTRFHSKLPDLVQHLGLKRGEWTHHYMEEANRISALCDQLQSGVDRLKLVSALCLKFDAFSILFCQPEVITTIHACDLELVNLEEGSQNLFETKLQSLCERVNQNISEEVAAKLVEAEGFRGIIYTIESIDSLLFLLLGFLLCYWPDTCFLEPQYAGHPEFGSNFVTSMERFKLAMIEELEKIRGTVMPRPKILSSDLHDVKTALLKLKIELMKKLEMGSTEEPVENEDEIYAKAFNMLKICDGKKDVGESYRKQVVGLQYVPRQTTVNILVCWFQ